jgi:hypothetical protein
MPCRVLNEEVSDASRASLARRKSDKVEGVKYRDLHHYTQGARDKVCWIAHARVAPKTPNCTVRKARSAVRVLSSLLGLRRITPSSNSSIRRDSIFEHARRAAVSTVPQTQYGCSPLQNHRSLLVYGMR